MTVKIGAKVKLNIEELQLGQWYGLESFKDYVLSDVDRVYTVIEHKAIFGSHYILDDAVFMGKPFHHMEFILVKEEA